MRRARSSRTSCASDTLSKRQGHLKSIFKKISPAFDDKSAFPNVRNCDICDEKKIFQQHMSFDTVDDVLKRIIATNLSSD
jgi:hypothetical protein